jgi:RNA polymerase sigma factor (sigma-70 family)
MAHEDAASHERSARDDEDARLLAAGDHAALLAAYYPTILLRLRVRRLPLDDAEEVRQRVVEHLLRELKSRKAFAVPFRVVVHQRTTWELLDYYAERKRREAELPDDQEDASADEFERVESDVDLERLLDELPGRERQVAVLRWQQGLEVAQIARLLLVEPNAVHQALFRAHRKLRESLG